MSRWSLIALWANKTSLRLIYRALKVPQAKRFYFMETVGNLAGHQHRTVSRKLGAANRLQPGMRVLMASFGNGLSWG